MPTDEAPIEVNAPAKPAATGPNSGILGLGSPVPAVSDEEQLALDSVPSVVRGSRWIDYDTHELLQMISELEDERRWARLREGIWIALLIHLALIAAMVLLPKYVFKVPPVVDRTDALKQHKDFTYLDTPWQAPPQPVIKPLTQPPLIDKQTMDELKKANPPAPTPAPAPVPAAVQPPPTPPSQQSQIEMPHPAAVPARPNFAMGSQNPADQLRDALRGAARNPGIGAGSQPGGGLKMHPGAGTGGLQILSDTQGVDFTRWLQYWYQETRRTWDPLIPDEVNPPISKAGQLQIRFKVLPSGRLMDGSLELEGSSGDVGLDRAAWGALTGSNYPPLPRDFHGPYLELRARFLYNMEPER
ncbi:MAG: energy transducer TonB [Terracidiphilus sp.]|jgi:outer membrane biosynthesis protein TonB